MKSIKYLLLVSSFASSFAFADLLTLKPGTVVKNGVNISTGATASVNGKTYELTTVGSGLRNKVVVFNIAVYIAQVMVADPARYVKTADGALPSLDNQKQIAIRLTFLRDVPADKVSTSFQDALDANKVAAKDVDMVNFMTVVNKGGDAKNAASLTIVLLKNDDGTETLAYENATNGTTTVIQGSKDLAHKIMSIWLGTVSEDSGLVALKAELLK
ncbi:MAG: chalcone isomerase family protein [Bdellovibrionales bacterium]